MFRKIGVLKTWKKSLNICVKELLLIQLEASSLQLYCKMNSSTYIFKGFAYILLNLSWFSTFFERFTENLLLVISVSEIKKISFLSSWNLLFDFEIHGWPICWFPGRDGGRQEEERKVSQKNTIQHILSMGTMFTGQFPVIWSCNC